MGALHLHSAFTFKVFDWLERLSYGFIPTYNLFQNM